MRGRLATWMTYFFSTPRGFLEYIITIDLSNAWRQHLVWSKKNGDELKTIVTQRFASSTVFLSLLFSSELGILYSPSDPGKEIRLALQEREYGKAEYWTGVVICFAIFFSVTALVANFTAMSVFSSLSKENAPVVLRSTLGLYTAQLPSRLVTGAIYLFFMVVVCTWIIIMQNLIALLISSVAGVLLVHIVNTFSSMGRVIMDSGAMSDMPILDPEEEEKMDPQELSDLLIKRVMLARKAQVPINHQYKVDYQATLRDVQEGKVSWPLTASELDERVSRFGLRKSKMGQATRNLGYKMSETVGSVVNSVASAASAMPGSGVANSIASRTIDSIHGADQNMPSVREEGEIDESQEIQELEQERELERRGSSEDNGF